MQQVEIEMEFTHIKQIPVHETQTYGLRFKLAAMISGSLLVLTACGGNPDDTPKNPDDTFTYTPDTSDTITPSAEPLPDTESESEALPSLCAGDEYCYTDRSEMDQAYENTIEYVEPFFEEMFENAPMPDNYYYISDEDGSWTTDCGELASESTLAFCSADNSIYLGQTALWDMYSTNGVGDAGLAFILAHESGHMLQHSAGIPMTDITKRETIPLENQADCVAGAWAGWAADSGYLNEQDAENFGSTLEAIQSYESNDRDHGTLSERYEAMILGVDTGLEGCNDFYSKNPLIIYE